MFEKVSRSLKYDSNIFFVHKHIPCSGYFSGGGGGGGGGGGKKVCGFRG